MTQKTFQHWTKEEESVVKELYPTHTARQISEILGTHSRIGVKNRARRFDIDKAADSWTEEEEDRLKLFHRFTDIDGLLELFPGRTIRSLRNKLYKMRITKRDPAWEFGAIDISLAYLLGMYLTDGCLSINGYSGSLCLKLQAIDEEFVEDSMAAYGNVCGKIYASTRLVKMREGNRHQPFTIGLVCNDLNWWIANETDWKKKFPKSIFDAPMESKLSFIAGMLDGDGWIREGKQPRCNVLRYSIGFCSASVWIYEFQNLLRSVGIKSTGPYKRILPSGKDFYDMCIDKKTFIENGGYFRIRRKQERLVRYAVSRLGLNPQRLNVPALSESVSQSELQGDLQTSQEISDAPPLVVTKATD